MEWRTERYDAISTRILDGSGKVVAMIESLSNGKWIITDRGRQVGKRIFASVKEAFAWWKTERAPLQP